MPHTPLLSAIVVIARRIDAEAPSRRAFLTTAAAAAALPVQAQTNPRVAIVGAGLAGLTAALPEAFT